MFRFKKQSDETHNRFLKKPFFLDGKKKSLIKQLNKEKEKSLLWVIYRAA